MLISLNNLNTNINDIIKEIIITDDSQSLIELKRQFSIINVNFPHNEEIIQLAVEHKAFHIIDFLINDNHISIIDIIKHIIIKDDDRMLMRIFIISVTINFHYFPTNNEIINLSVDNNSINIIKFMIHNYGLGNSGIQMVINYCVETRNIITLRYIINNYSNLTNNYDELSQLEDEQLFDRLMNQESSQITHSSDSILGNILVDSSDICCICITSNCNWSLPCKHNFCKSCLQKWFREHNTCPLCRYECK